MADDFQLGITKSFDCSYLPNEQERLLVAVDPRFHNSERYSWLMAQGFRRSGDQIYRPHCLACTACQSIRVVIDDFSTSKSQKRLIKRNAALSVSVSYQVRDMYYELYENYINSIHRDGSMYPATHDQYKSFIRSNITNQVYLEVWDEELLVAVAVTDVLADALSAVYTFYHPNYRRHGIGIFSILNQIEYTESLEKKYLYLGYQINDCQKMNYKNKFFTHQVLTQNSWKTVNK